MKTLTDKYVRPKFFKDEFWFEFCVDAFPSGSRYICSPPVLDSDEDFLCLVDPETVLPFEQRLLKEGFRVGGSMSKSRNRLVYIYRPGTLDNQGIWHFADTPERMEFDDEIEIERQTELGVRFWDSDVRPRSVEIDLTGLPRLKTYPDFEDRSQVFRSWKKDDQNLILTCSVEYFDNFWCATRLATRLNLREKKDRIAVFEAVAFDKWP